MRVLTAAFAVVLLLFSAAATPGPETLLLTGGVVHTMNGSRDIAEALAIADGKIIAVGSNQKILALKNQQSTVIEMKGGSLFPGFTDGHVHPLKGGAALTGLWFSDQDDIARIQQKLRAYLLANPEKTVITGSGWSLKQFQRGNPHKSLLDAVVSDRPVILVDSNHHSTWVNSEALKQAGITRDTPNPRHGVIERDDNGEPSGTLRETAESLVAGLIEPPSTEEKARMILAGLRLLNSLGYTAVLGASVDITDDDAWRLASQSRLASIHLALLPDSLPISAEKDLQRLPNVLDELVSRRKSLAASGLTADKVKIFLDGGLESCTAAFLGFYAEAGCGAGHVGLLNYPPAFLNEYVGQLDKNGFAVHVHAIGDRATRIALDAIPGDKSGPAHAISHLQFVHPADAGRFSQKHVTAVLQTLWAFPYDDSMRPFTDTAIGPWRYPFGQLFEQAAPLAIGSDWPVSTPNPFHALEVAVRRQDPLDSAADRLLPEQAISVDTFMEALTIGGARYLGEDQTRGTIEAGKAADLVLLSNNPYQTSSVALSQIRVVWTLFRGEFVHEGFAAANRTVESSR